jgi:hypothetical protein
MKMKLTKDIINDNFEKYKNFQYYHTIIDLIEENILINPDITIESCKALFEGIAKTILSHIDIHYSNSGIENKTVQSLIKDMFCKLKIHIDVEEHNYISLFVKEIGSIRNKRGDISHGRPSPKEVVSDALYSKMVVNATDNYIFYILSLYFSIDFNIKEIIKFDEYEEFNEWLDELDSVGFMKRYSLALYETDYIRYEQELQNYYPELEI